MPTPAPSLARQFTALLSLVPRRSLAALFALMLAAGLTEGVGLLMLVPLLEMLQPGTGGHSGLLSRFTSLLPAAADASPLAMLSVFIVLIALRSGLLYGREVFGVRLQNQLVDSLRERCFSALLRAEWRWLSSRRQTDHSNLLLTDIQRVGTSLNFGLSLLTMLATMAAYAAAALLLSWRLALLALVTGGIVFALLARQRRQATTLGQMLGATNQALHAAVQDSLSGLKLAKILGNESHHRLRMADRMAQMRRQQQDFQRGSSLSRALLQVGGAVLLSAYLYAGLSWWRVPVAQLLPLVLIFSRMIPLLSGALQQLHLCLHALPALGQTQTLLAECEAAAEPAHAESQTAMMVSQEIVLDGIMLTHSGRDVPALASVSLVLPARTTTAMMGESGAGKSTLADVLTGLLMPDSGELRVDGVPITGTTRMAWRRAVSYVPQEVTLFHDSIRNNLLWGCADASEPAMLEALQRAAADFVFRLPQGIDTVIGDQGVRLSGGERQRLALARALLRRPALLILDEATSALDRDNERRIRQAIENLHGDLTVLIIGHRLSTLEHADQVVVLDHGRIRAQGKWSDINEHTAVAQ